MYRYRRAFVRVDTPTGFLFVSPGTRVAVDFTQVDDNQTGLQIASEGKS